MITCVGHLPTILYSVCVTVFVSVGIFYSNVLEVTLISPLYIVKEILICLCKYKLYFLTKPMLQ